MGVPNPIIEQLLSLTRSSNESRREVHELDAATLRYASYRFGQIRRNPLLLLRRGVGGKSHHTVDDTFLRGHVSGPDLEPVLISKCRVIREELLQIVRNVGRDLVA